MIEIIAKPMKIEIEGSERWCCDLWVTQDTTTWYIPATAPGELEESELQAHFEADEDCLWNLACIKQYPPDVFENVGAKRLVKALALAMLDEINRSRMADRQDMLTKKDWRDMILGKVKGG